jgi:hypothetical protein
MTILSLEKLILSKYTFYTSEYNILSNIYEIIQYNDKIIIHKINTILDLQKSVKLRFNIDIEFKIEKRQIQEHEVNSLYFYINDKQFGYFHNCYNIFPIPKSNFLNDMYHLFTYIYNNNIMNLYRIVIDYSFDHLDRYTLFIFTYDNDRPIKMLSLVIDNEVNVKYEYNY